MTDSNAPLSPGRRTLLRSLAALPLGLAATGRVAVPEPEPAPVEAAALEPDEGVELPGSRTAS
jgi:hypothetical protein